MYPAFAFVLKEIGRLHYNRRMLKYLRLPILLIAVSFYFNLHAGVSVEIGDGHLEQEIEVKDKRSLMKANIFLEERVHEFPFWQKFRRAQKEKRSAQLVIIGDSFMDWWRYAKIFQTQALKELAKSYGTIRSHYIDTNDLSLKDGDLDMSPPDHIKLIFESHFDQALYNARTSTYLGNENTDYYFIVVGEDMGEISGKVWRDIEYLDKVSKALVFVGRKNSIKDSLFKKISHLEPMTQNISVLDLAEWSCERILTD